MPGGDRTGPLGQGRMTGRGLGYCAGNGAPGFGVRPGRMGRGMAWGGGGRRNRFWSGAGMGWGQSFYAPAVSEQSPESERQMLREELAELKRRFDSLIERLSALDVSEQENKG